MDITFTKAQEYKLIENTKKLSKEIDSSDILSMAIISLSNLSRDNLDMSELVSALLGKFSTKLVFQ